MLKHGVRQGAIHLKIKRCLPEAGGGVIVVVWTFLSKVTVALFPRWEAVKFADCWPDRMMFPLDVTS